MANGSNIVIKSFKCHVNQLAAHGHRTLGVINGVVQEPPQANGRSYVKPRLRNEFIKTPFAEMGNAEKTETQRKKAKEMCSIAVARADAQDDKT